MAHVFITGSADGLGRAAAQTLLDKKNVVNEIVIRTNDYTKAEPLNIRALAIREKLAPDSSELAVSISPAVARVARCHFAILRDFAVLGFEFIRVIRQFSST